MIEWEVYNMDCLCHACKKIYKKIFKAKKYLKWADDKKRKYHWSKCERIGNNEFKIDSDRNSINKYIFSFCDLGFEVRDALMHFLDEDYMRSIYNNKTDHELMQPEYIDKYTTAYRSDIMREIIKHK